MRLKIWRRSATAKAIALILLIVASVVGVLSVIGARIMIGENLYEKPEDEYLQELYEKNYKDDARALLTYLMEDRLDLAENYCNNRNFSYVVIRKTKKDDVLWSWYRGVEEESKIVKSTWAWYNKKAIEAKDESYINRMGIEIGILNPPVMMQDQYQTMYRIVSAAYRLLYGIYFIGLAALLIVMGSFAFLIWAAGYGKGSEEVSPGLLGKIPFDLFTLIMGALVIALLSEGGKGFSGDVVLQLLFWMAIGVALEIVLVTWCINLAKHVKMSDCWKSTLCHRFSGTVQKGLAEIPAIWKTAVIMAGITFLEFAVILLAWDELAYLQFFWFVEKIVLIPAVLWAATCLKKLQKGGEALAAGNLEYQVDTVGMPPDFKRHGENLSSIAQGMNNAVEARLKSERLKTELITNVSHDIKTPLTSIINYADLIEREDCENARIKEYAQVLLRQSERLKKLIDDLMEASKASTGNLEVNLVPCEAQILLTQATGEFEKRLQEAGLELIVRVPEEPIRMMADSRHLWRVFENLMGNICKYAQKGTRVYLSLEEIPLPGKGKEAVFTFRNISQAEIGFSADELMERFVRGDISRSTEGNGLGLAIAKSLTEVQNGKFDLTVDGDLFKVTLRFPVLRE